MSSSTTLKLIDYSKQECSKFDIESIRQFLMPDYHYEMNVRDVMSILLNALEEVIDEPRFQIHYGRRIWREIILGPLKMEFDGSRIDSVEQVYENYCREIMFAFRYTRKDWY